MVGQRLDRLDGLRGIAAAGVAFLYHPLLEFDPAIMGRAFAPVVWLREYGWTFVDLFFLISGYIFAHVYLGERTLGRGQVAEFAVARFARLYPLHLLMLLVCALLYGGAADNTWRTFIAHLFLAQGFVEPVSHSFNGPSWSISIEVVCYIVFVGGAVRGDRALRWITGAAIVLALAYLALLGRPSGPWSGDCLPRGLLGFFLGQVMWRCQAYLARVPAAALLAVLGLGLWIDMGAASSLPPICLLAWPAALCLVLRMPVMGSRALLWLGDRSYTIYLVHFPVLLIVIPVLESANEGWLAAAITLGYAAFVLIVSDMIYSRFEVPARRAIRSAWGQRSRVDAGRGIRPV